MCNVYIPPQKLKVIHDLPLSKASLFGSRSGAYLTRPIKANDEEQYTTSIRYARYES